MSDKTIKKHLTNRKYRLFTVACARELWDIMTDRRCRAAVEVSERFADGEITAEQLLAARDAVRWRSKESVGYLAYVSASDPPVNVCGVVWRVTRKREGINPEQEADFYRKREARDVALLREVVGNPFRPVSLAPAVLAWEDGIVSRVTEGIYRERAFDRLPILADALQDAGACDEAI